MKKQKENICKFVTHSTPTPTLTTNFVWKTNNKDVLCINMRQNHAMYLVVSGTGSLCTEHTEYDLRAGTLFFILTGSSCKITNKQDLNYMYISFNGERAQELLERFKISPVNCVFHKHEALIVFWQNALEKANNENIDLISESILLQSFSIFSQQFLSKEETL